MADKCHWTYIPKSETYESDCGRTWIPTETSYKINEMNYCVFCGKPVDIEGIEQVK